MLFPPETPPEKIGLCGGVASDDDINDDKDDYNNDNKVQQQLSSVSWFEMYHDRVTATSWPGEWRPVDLIQKPGETVFVPAGWAHAVLNLELTVAVTHNYASEFGPSPICPPKSPPSILSSSSTLNAMEKREAKSTTMMTGPSFEGMWEQVVLHEPEFTLRWYRGLAVDGQDDLVERILAHHTDAVRNRKVWVIGFHIPW